MANTKTALYLNERVEVIKVNKRASSADIRYDDGLIETVALDDLHIFTNTKGTAIKRSKRVNPINGKRAKTKFARNFGSVERVAAIQAMNCVVCGRTPCQNAHVTARGMGGYNGSYQDVIPLCPSCHREQGELGNSRFADKHGISYEAAIAETRRKLGE